MNHEMTFHYSQIKEECLKPRDQIAHKCSKTGRVEWAGVPFDQALMLAENGDSILAKKIDERAEKISMDVNIENNTLKLVDSSSGGSVNVSDFLLGLPECMSDFELRRDKSRVINILFNGGVNSNISHEALVSYGSALFTTIRALEMRGYSVGLIIGYGNSGYDCGKHNVYVVLKEPGELIEAGIAAFWIANPASYRRLVFRLWENFFPELTKYPEYGRAGEALTIAENTLYFKNIHEISSDVWGYIKAESKKFGIDLLN